MTFLTYGSYLKLDELLALQQPLSDGPEHDEMLFIVIHQIYELWFKQILHETELLQHSLETNEIPTALHTFKRILTILKMLVHQVDVLETMTPLSFASFRPRLERASGFQSWQFRELEFVLGKRNANLLKHYPETSQEHQRLKTRLARPSLYASFLRLLHNNGYAVPESVLQESVLQHESSADHADKSEVSVETQPCPAVQRVLIDVYRTNPQLMQLCERMVDLDEGFQEWRYRHVKMVERTIGTKRGTGGSSGAEYLRSTLFRPFFPDLWAIRVDL